MSSISESPYAIFEPSRTRNNVYYTNLSNHEFKENEKRALIDVMDRAMREDETRRYEENSPFTVIEGETFICQSINSNRLSRGLLPVDPSKSTLLRIKKQLGISVYVTDERTAARRLSDSAAPILSYTGQTTAEREITTAAVSSSSLPTNRLVHDVSSSPAPVDRQQQGESSTPPISCNPSQRNNATGIPVATQIANLPSKKDQRTAWKLLKLFEKETRKIQKLRASLNNSQSQRQPPRKRKATEETESQLSQEGKKRSSE